MQTIVKRNHATQVTEGSMTTLVSTGNRAATIAGSEQVDAGGSFLLDAGGDSGMKIGGTMVTSASAWGVGSGNINIDLDGSVGAAGNVSAGGEVFGTEVYSLTATLGDLLNHTHDYIDSVGSAATPVQKATFPFVTVGSTTAVAGPSAAEATAVEAFDPTATNTKTNVLATFGDEENLTRDTQEGVLTITGRFLTFEPCPEHVNKGAPRDDS